MTGNVNIWEFRTASGHSAGTDLIDFHVEATDGPIGKVDKLSEEVDSQHLVVDTGPWIFGRRVLLPAGTVSRIEIGERKVYVDRSRDEIKNGPGIDAGATEPEDADFRDPYLLYYGPFYGGFGI
ncbi:PRC-barrel domain containing protein [Kitasatospora sp. NBC_01250]|uniref:PRC-barrel domain containing protein n=1 Tax=unclassified Kitasatospora TaxID=2633591 RepID=UPI002E153B20|nr:MULTISPECIES: PRC-barrel domain containing protein [unclassified Kitasatospora]WSJ71351.1 PRC-barrel domain containing protein [Kitasatospora sp. NBC_01302]